MPKKDYSDYSRGELVKEIYSLRKRKKYGIIWDEETNPEKVVQLCKKELPTLDEIKEKEIVENKKNKYNIIIEGDNYHALSVLNYTHQKKIDIIYIDPPYNTGNNDFKYNDRWVEREDSYRHSKWLTFMEKRLKLSRYLLKNSGAIFISIDDNEFSQLKLLCDQVFGEKNFISVFIWRKKKGGGNDSRYTAVETEYVLAYARNQKYLEKWSIKHDEDYLKRYKEKDGHGRFFWDTFQRAGLQHPIVYTVTAPDGKKIKGNFIRSEKRFKTDLADGTIRFVKTKNKNWSIQFKQYLPSGKKPRSLLPENSVDTNSTGKKQIEEFFGDPKFFTNPKPIGLIEYFIDIGNKDAIILDFMAGSGTTGEATLKINKKDGGQRNFILCTNNEEEICEKICYPRIKKVMQGYVGKVSKKQYAPLGGNLKYYHTNFVGASPTDKNKKELVNKSTEMLCLRESTFDLIKKNKNYSIFTNNKKNVGIIYDEDSIDSFKKEIKKLDKKTNVYVFSLGTYAHDDQFKDIKNLITLNPIPEAILAVYRRIFKTNNKEREK